jgi:hypothetical protein
MRLMNRVRASSIAFLVMTIGVYSQSPAGGAPPSDPIQYVSDAHFLKNSWGACTGDAGYFYMDANYVKKRAQAVYVITPGG